MNQVKTNSKKNFVLPDVVIPEQKNKGLPIPQQELDLLKERHKEKLLFSFRFFDRNTEAFNLGETNRVCDNWYISLLDILKEVSSLNRNELVVEKRQFYDAHAHDWDNLKYKYKLPNDLLNQVECLQFRLSQSRGRVHGFIIGNRFYIVWLDPHHNLYPDERFGGEKYYSRPLSCSEVLEGEVIKLSSLLKNKQEELDYLYSEIK
jgi:hypothetical protein